MLRVHPGRILAREMAARKLTANSLALKLRVPSNRISEIVAERRGPEWWSRLQADCDLSEAERRLGNTIRRQVKAAYTE
jgi:antitoxin HigA-1